MTFPVSPYKGDTHTHDDTIYVFNGVDWDRSVIGSNNSTDYGSNALFDRLEVLESLGFLNGYASETYVGTQLAALIDAAPGTLDTLNEIAAAIGDDSNYATTIANSIATVQADVDQNESDADVAIAALQADVNANETAAAALVTTLETARNVITAAISARVTTLEADPTTATALAAVQTNVDQNETDADSALATLTTNLNNEGAARLLSDNALGARVTTLEADPTTATAVAAVQTDVDANEAAALTARNAIQTDVDANEVTAAGLVTAQNTAMLAAVAVVQADVNQNEADCDSAINTEKARIDAILSGSAADKDTFAEIVTLVNSVDTTNDNAFAGYVTSNNAAVAALQLDVNNNESDADTAIAAVQTDVDANEVTAANAVTAAAGVAAAATAAQNTTMLAAVAVVQADVDQNETDADAAIAVVQADVDQNESDADTAIAAVQADVDQNESDADTAIALKANKAGDTFTGDIIIDEGTGSTIKLETSDATSAGIHIEGPSGSMGYIDTTNGFGNDSLQVYSANFWLRSLGGGTGNLIVDGTIKLSGGLTDAANDSAAASAGVAVGQLYRNGSVVMIRVS